MEIYQLKVFSQVAHYLSFTEAANSLNLTQPAVSAKIKSLESEIGAALFYRLGRTVQLTEIGQFLLDESQSLIEQEVQLCHKLEQYKQRGGGTLKIACSPAIASGWLPASIFRYRQSYPDIAVKLQICQSVREIYDAIASGNVNLGVSEVDFSEGGQIACQPIAEIQYCAFVASDSVWARQDCLSLRDAIGLPWVLGREDFVGRSVFEARVSELGLGLDDLARVETVETTSLMRAYILEGGYLGFASNLEFRSEVESGCLKIIPLHEFSLPAGIYLALPDRIQKIIEAADRTPRRQNRIASPTQKLLQLLEDFPQKTPTFWQDRSNSASLRPKLRSPRFSISIRPQKDIATLPIRIGIQNQTLPTATAGLAMQKLGLLEHYLPRSGRYAAPEFDIQWQNFATGTPIVDGLHSSQLDIGILGDYPLLLSAARNAAVAETQERTVLVGFVAINPDGCRNAAIVPHRSNLTDIDDLRGQRLAVPDGSAAHGMAIRVLHQMGLLSEVDLLPVRDGLRQMSVGAERAIAGYVHFSPFHELALENANFRYLFDGNLNGLPAFYGVVARSSFARTYPELVVSYLQGLMAAQHWLTTVAAAMPLLSQWTDNSLHLVSHILGTRPSLDSPGLYFPDLQIRSDWIAAHIDRYQSVPNGTLLADIQLGDWIQSEFLAAAQRN
ncbi:LysR substrate-binding domain-containing protein [Synechococcus sp. PCC 7336]|uniref:LysR family transcriptional regulator n=1 Tax=Synechococcus sp. PCC 7336 TaxID=195250 RepID=UPI0003494EE5|nr:LysR substrate-binding domain-containing protein [Synechococcus sp. PCC 7336]